MQHAVGHVNGEIADLLRGRSWSSLSDVDAAMIDLDGTPNKARLGANAIIGTSMALARALASSAGKPLFAWLPGFGAPPRLPVPNFNVLNGGVHAPNALDFQEFMISPLGAPTLAEAIRAGAEVYSALKKRLASAGHATGLGDEGGFAPDLAAPEDVRNTNPSGPIAKPHQKGSVLSGSRIPAASEFVQPDGSYLVNGTKLSADDMIERYAAMADAYPIWSIEDGLGEADHDGWQRLTARLGDRLQLVGDDNFCTNPAIIAASIYDGIANAALIEPRPDRIRHRAHRGDGHVSPGGLPANGVAPLGRDPRHLHCRSRRRHRMWADQNRGTRSRRAGGEVQPTDRDRRSAARSGLRPGLRSLAK